MQKAYMCGEVKFNNMTGWDHEILNLWNYAWMFCCAYLKNTVKMNKKALVKGERNVMYDNKILLKLVSIWKYAEK